MYIERWQFARDAGIKRWCVTKTLDHTISGQRLFITPSWKWASVVQPSNFPWPVPTSSDSAIIRILLFGMLIITLVIIFILYSVLELQSHGHSGSKLACLVKQTGKPHFNLAGTKKPALTDIPDYLGASFGQRAIRITLSCPRTCGFSPWIWALLLPSMPTVLLCSLHESYHSPDGSWDPFFRSFPPPLSVVWPAEISGSRRTTQERVYSREHCVMAKVNPGII